jgi:hypothetical protein
MFKANCRFRIQTKLVGRVVSRLAVIFLTSYSYAQSCALCYTQAASSGSRIIHGLRSGILVLIIPPMFMSVGITILAYRKRNKFNPGSAEKDSRNNGW